MADVLMTGDEVRAAQVQAAISIRSDRPETENRHHGDVVNICNDWLRLSRENADLRDRLESAERERDALRKALREAERATATRRLTGGYCPWCSTVRDRKSADVKHSNICPFGRLAPLGAAREEQEPAGG